MLSLLSILASISIRSLKYLTNYIRLQLLYTQPQHLGFDTMTTPDLTQSVIPAPPGLTSNFANPANQAVLAYSILIAALVLSTMFAWGRLLVKKYTLRTLHREDCKLSRISRFCFYF
jgi:hypothetical protein